MVRSRYWFTSISVQKKPYRSCTHSKYDTVTPPALHRMSGITSTPRANNSLSAPGVVGPLAASATILAVILIFTGISSINGFGTSSISNPGPHGFTQMLYSYVSGAGNNGSAFAGLNPNTLWYNTTIGFTMLIGRFLMMIPMLAIAGNLAQKKYVPQSLGTFPVTTPLFTVLLIGVILIVGALTFFPALSLGPILEHLLMAAGKTF